MIPNLIPLDDLLLNLKQQSFISNSEIYSSRSNASWKWSNHTTSTLPSDNCIHSTDRTSCDSYVWGIEAVPCQATEKYSVLMATISILQIECFVAASKLFRFARMQKPTKYQTLFCYQTLMNCFSNLVPANVALLQGSGFTLQCLGQQTQILFSQEWNLTQSA